ncbi:MAG TPA: fatty acid desaturase [Candidatus Polarisedimenticolaceae bacterium]|nr:fatty acid desaturase [Candidatus Polarisedimenticolaceae bacterium]
MRAFEKADPSKAAYQLLTTFLALVLAWGATYVALAVHPLLAVLPGLAAVGLLVRVFIMAHDCAHGSFLPSRRWNDRVGRLCAFLALTPFAAWRHSHVLHHAQVGNLDERGTGDIWTLTVREYREASPLRRLRYRVFRNPLVLFGLGPVLYFGLWQRIPPRGHKRAVERRSILWTDLALLAVGMPLLLLFGTGPLLLHLGLLGAAASVGSWLFYVQHQFSDTYWAEKKGWTFEDAALQGSSYYRLPRLLQWFSGNIGFHHVHHYAARIPNYHLERAHESWDAFKQSPTLGFWRSLRSLPLALWDEEGRRLVSFRAASRLPA